MSAESTGPPAPRQPRYQRRGVQRTKSVLLPVIAIVLMASLIIPVILFAIVGTGLTPVVFGTVFAMLPVIPVVAAFLWVDRWEPEPGLMLLMAFFWGAGVAVVSSLVAGLALAAAWESVVTMSAADVLGTAVTAPTVEEGVKGLFLVGVLLFRRRELDGPVDGVVYAGLVAAGFAFTENILYLGGAFAADGLVGGLATFFFRCVLSPFAHPLFTSMVGLGVGIAVRRSSRSAKVAWVLGGYLAAAGLHAVWNGTSILLPGDAFLFAYALVMVPLFTGMIVLVVWQRRREQRLVAAALPAFATAGWIAPSEVSLLASLAGRRQWRRHVNRRSGPQAERAVRDYQAAVTELAFLRDRMARGTVGAEANRWHDEVLTELAAARARAVGRHPNALWISREWCWAQ